MSDDVVIQPDDDLSKPPTDLNDYQAWLDRGQLGFAMEGLLNKVAGIVGNEQTARILVEQLRKEQAARDEQLAGKIERFAFSLKTDWSKSIGSFDERLDVYGAHIDEQRDEIKALSALVEERTASFFDLAKQLSEVREHLAEVRQALSAGQQGNQDRIEEIDGRLSDLEGLARSPDHIPPEEERQMIALLRELMRERESAKRKHE